MDPILKLPAVVMLDAMITNMSEVTPSSPDGVQLQFAVWSIARTFEALAPKNKLDSLRDSQQAVERVEQFVADVKAKIAADIQALEQETST